MKTYSGITKLLLAATVVLTPARATEYIVLLKASNGQYVNSTGYGGGPPGGNGLPRGRMKADSNFGYGTLTAHILDDPNGGSLMDGDTVYLRLGTQGLYVCAENGGGGWVNGNRISAGGWEAFTIRKVNGTGQIGDLDQIALQTATGNYVCAENGGGTYLIADRPR